MPDTIAQYVQRVEIQRAPVENRIPNPCAEVGLSSVEWGGPVGTRVTGLSLDGNFYGTAFQMVGSATLNSYLAVGGGPGALRLGMEPGKTYTARATYHLPAVLAGTSENRARRIVVPVRLSDGSYADLLGPQVPNTAGYHQTAFTFTVPAGATEAFVRFYHGHPSGTVRWYNLRLSEGDAATAGTDYFDGLVSGDTLGGSRFDDDETGWDGKRGESTSWRVKRSENVTLQNASIRSLSMDSRRIPYVQAIIEAPIPDGFDETLVDVERPRDVIVNWAVEHRDAAGALVSILPAGWSAGTAGKLWLREATLSRKSRTMRLVAESGEVRLEDKRRMASSTLDTGATTALALFEYAVTDVGEAAALGGVSSPEATAAIPAGDRRLWLQGESAAQLFEAELASVGCRAFCDERGQFSARLFTSPPAYGSGSVSLDGLVTDAQETRRRRDARDATLVRSNYTNAAGTSVTQYQVFPASGLNRFGHVETMSRPIPASNYAQLVTERARGRGRVLELEASLTMAVRPGRTVVSNYGTGVCQRVDYRPADGLMTVQIAKG